LANALVSLCSWAATARHLANALVSLCSWAASGRRFPGLGTGRLLGGSVCGRRQQEAATLASRRAARVNRLTPPPEASRCAGYNAVQVNGFRSKQRGAIISPCGRPHDGPPARSQEL